MPPAPPTFSMMTCWPSTSESFRPTMRPSTSVPPPAAKPTTMVTGRVGQLLARMPSRPRQQCQPRQSNPPMPHEASAKFRLAFQHSAGWLATRCDPISGLLDPCRIDIAKRSVRCGRTWYKVAQIRRYCRRRAAMSLQTLGYIGLRTKNLDDWTAYASRFLGMQLVDKSRGTASFRMDDKKQRLVVNESDAEAPGLLRLGGGGRSRARRLRRQSRTPQGFVRARLARARRGAQGPRPDRAVRPGRQPPRNLPRRRDHDRAVQARPRHLRLPHRPARHGARRAPLREDRRHRAVLPRHPRLPAQRLFPASRSRPISSTSIRATTASPSSNPARPASII